MEIASKKTIAKYGSLMRRDKLDAVLQKVNTFIDSHSEYFDNSKWDKIFNEYTFFNENGKELRIDRLMIDTTKKEILIVDFKTGSIYEEEQLDRYKEVIEKLPVVKQDGYRVETEFCVVEV